MVNISTTNQAPGGVDARLETAKSYGGPLAIVTTLFFMWAS